jgi:hypothetical protein
MYCLLLGIFPSFHLSFDWDILLLQNFMLCDAQFTEIWLYMQTSENCSQKYALVGDQTVYLVVVWHLQVVFLM